MLGHKLEKPLANQRLSRLVLIKQEKRIHDLQESYQEKPRESIERTASKAWHAWFLRR